MTSAKRALNIVSANLDGHRGDYLRCLHELAGSTGATVTVVAKPRLKHVLSPDPLFFTMIEEFFLLYSIVSVSRQLLGLRTAGLLFRPGPCVNPVTWKTAVKRLTLRVLKSCPQAHTLSIVPFWANPEIEQIATDWVFDLQFWDLPLLYPEGPIWTAPQTSSACKPGPIDLIAVGAQTDLKGFDKFVSLAEVLRKAHPSIKIAVAGRIDSECTDAVYRLHSAGALVENRKLGERELLEYVSNSRLVWACYPPSYDQSSGIVGRAYQLNAPVVVRAGSLIEEIVNTVGLQNVAIPYDDLDRASSAIISYTRLAARDDAPEQRKLELSGHCADHLLLHLGLSPND